MCHYHANWFIVAVAVVLACCGPAAAQQPAGAAACAVEMRGSQASLSCSRGAITASADPSIRRQLQQGPAAKAVTWTEGSCGVEDGGSCMLTICGVQGNGPLNLQLVVANASGDPEQLWSIVCIAGSTKTVIQGATIIGNIVAGLVVDGAADVTISSSNFTENNRARYGGSALIAWGQSTVRVTQTGFVANAHGEDDTYGGIVVLKGSSKATFDGCSFVENKPLYAQAGAILATNSASVVLSDCSFVDNVAIFGGALRATGQATVKMSGCSMRDNWASFGGAVYVDENSTVSIVNSSMVGNSASDHNQESPDGGAAYLYDSATLSISGTVISGNSALGRGGGVAMGSTSSTLQIGPGTRIEGNKAARGGGLYITRKLQNMAQVAPYIVGNTASISNDVGSQLTQLVVLNKEAASTFRPRLNENKALLPVKLRLTGPEGLPGAAGIQAMLGDKLVARGESSPVIGEAVLDVDLRNSPGSYILQFAVISLPAVNTSLPVEVQGCGPGEVSVAGEQACNVCPRGSFSLDPAAQECSRCPEHAVCEGGAIVPVPGFWSSFLRSNQPHRCLFRPACSQDHTDAALTQYQANPVSNTSEAAFMEAQCAQGHEAALCAKCSKGFGQRMSALVGRCQPCASTASIIVVYLLAALASLAFIRLLCFFYSIQQGGLGAAGSRKSLVLPHPLHELAAAGASSAPSLPNLSETGRAPDGFKAGGSDSAGAHKMLSSRDQLPAWSSKGQAAQPGPFAEAAAVSGSCAACGRTCTCAAAGAVGSAAAGPNTSSRAPVGDLMKPFTIYLQWMLVVATINVQWPPAMAGPFLAISWFFASSSTSTGLDCLLSQRSLPLPVAKTLVGLCMPIALLAVLLCADAVSVHVRAALRRQRSSQHSRRVLPAGVFARTSIVLTFFFLPSLLRTAYSLFACVQLDDAAAAARMEGGSTYYHFGAIGRYWLLDVDQKCFQGYHRAAALGLGIPLLLLVCVAVPFGIVGYLYYNRSRLQEPYYLEHFGFLFLSYRPSRYYWEGVMAMQTCIVVAISVFGATLGAAFQCILLTAACGVAQTLLGVFKPFAFREANLVSMQAFGCLVLSAQAALVFELLVMADGSTAAAANGVAAFVLFVNILFVLSVLWRVVTAVDWAGLGGTAGKVGKAAAAKLGGCGGGSAGSGGCWGRARPPAV